MAESKSAGRSGAADSISEPGDEMRLGIIGRPHGVLGAVFVHLHHAGSDALDHLGSLTLVQGKKRRSYAVKSVRPSGKSHVVQLDGVNSREAATELTGAELWAPRTELPALEPGEYYLVDLVGCEVELCGEVIGSVESVRADPSVDTMRIALKKGGFAEQPIVDHWVSGVDIAQRRVTLANDDGLIDE
jgi:16S rRNA processing protein RimM